MLITPRQLDSVSHDHEELTRSLALFGWDADLTQVGKGLFDGRISVASSSTAYLSRNQFSHRLQITVASRPETLAFAIPQEGVAIERYQGMKLERGPAVLASDNSEPIHMVSSLGCDFLAFYFGGPALRHLRHHLELNELGDFSKGAHLFNPCPEALNRFRAKTFAAIGVGGELLGNDAMSADLASEYLRLIASCDPRDQASRTPLSQRIRQAGRAREFIEGHLDQNISLAQICSAAGVRARALQYCFLEVFGVTPISYVKLRRLKRAHKLLCSGTPETTTVTEAALESGFWQFGRFSQAYRTHYGELPSVTLKRAGRRLR